MVVAGSAKVPKVCAQIGRDEANRPHLGELTDMHQFVCKQRGCAVLDVVAAQEYKPPEGHAVGCWWQQVRADDAYPLEDSVRHMVKHVLLVIFEATASSRPRLSR